MVSKRYYVYGIKRRNGFTLLELLIAIAMFVVIATIVYSTFNAVLSRNRAIAEGADTFEMAKNCLDRMTFDLSATYVEPFPLYKPPGITENPDPYRFFGEQRSLGGASFSELRFVSTDHLPITDPTDSDLAEIRYYVTQGSDPDAGGVLRRADTAYPYNIDDHLQKSEDDPVLCTGIEAFTLTFYDVNGDAHDTWDSDSDFNDNATPRAVAIHLEIKAGTGTRSFDTRVSLPVYRDSREDENKK